MKALTGDPELIDFEHALTSLLASAHRLDREPAAVPLREAAGRVLASAVRLDRTEPPAARSAMDGYAIRSADGALPRRVVATVFAGSAARVGIGPGETAAVMTGGTVPEGADAVVPIEQTRREAADRGGGDDGEARIAIIAPVAPGQHIRPAGEMGAAGMLAIAAGTRLGAGELAVAAACGADPVEVAAKPWVSVLSTGDEVVPWTARPAAHQVRDSNRLAALAQLERMGAAVVETAIVPDVRAQLLTAVESALDRSDLLVTIGGVSMGERDHLPGVFAELRVRCLFHGVAMQPGKPVWAGRRDDRWVLALPGNPVSAFVCLELFGGPLVARLSGVSAAAERPAVRVGIAGGPARAKGRPCFLPAGLRVDAEGQTVVVPRAGTGSGDWLTLSGAHALMLLPAHSSVAEGERVRYVAW